MRVLPVVNNPLNVSFITDGENSGDDRRTPRGIVISADSS